MYILRKTAVKLGFPRKTGEKSDVNDRCSPAVTMRRRCLYNDRRNTDHAFAWLYSFSVITDNRMRLVTAVLTNPNKRGGYLCVGIENKKPSSFFNAKFAVLHVLPSTFVIKSIFLGLYRIRKKHWYKSPVKNVVRIIFLYIIILCYVVISVQRKILFKAS